VEQDDKGWDARKRAYCLKIQPATGSFARNLIYSTKPPPFKKNVSQYFLNIKLFACNNIFGIFCTFQNMKINIVLRIRRHNELSS
ncbi:hypothetical protein, partial [Enterobacter roggenkampii]|uniref:hypothetical protein n=1 Tax=Enterobacter roggenkampii TaxID=1812935 RepID=UPI0020063EA4